MKDEYLQSGCQHKHICLKALVIPTLTLKMSTLHIILCNERRGFKRIGATRLALYVLLYDDFNANNWKCIQWVPQGQSSRSSQCLPRQNNRLLKCQPVSLKREWKVVGLVGQHWGDVCGFFFFLFWRGGCHLMSHGLGIIFTRVTCQKISIEGTFCHIHIYQPTDCPRGTSRSHPHYSKAKLISTASAWME